MENSVPTSYSEKKNWENKTIKHNIYCIEPQTILWSTRHLHFRARRSQRLYILELIYFYFLFLKNEENKKVQLKYAARSTFSAKSIPYANIVTWSLKKGDDTEN